MPYQASKSTPGTCLEERTWLEAEAILTEQAVVVIPLGAAAKEHGPHLKLNNDWVLAQYLKRRIVEQADVVVLPTISYHYYPAFTEYPGSISLSLATARDLITEVCKSVAAHGPYRFYVLNTGVSTTRALEAAAGILQGEGIVLRFTDIMNIVRSVELSVMEQAGGSHADEIETSMMLYIDPKSVDMSKAVKDYHPGTGLTRKPGGQGAYSATGVYGDATLATREKGEVVVEALVSALLRDIGRLRAADR